MRLKSVNHSGLICLLIIFLAAYSPIFAQIECTAKSKALLDSCLLAVQGLGENPEVTKIGKIFLGKPYVSKTLETGSKENLVINPGELDCTTFLENVVALKLLADKKELNEESFFKTLEQIRYRDGKMSGYASRLHYLSEWLTDGEKKGFIKPMTQKLGGVKDDRMIDFMSTHRSAYSQLAEDAVYVKIQEVEKSLNKIQRYYIPKEKVAAVENQIPDGAIIAITTTIKGLDMIHVGLACHQNGKTHLLHASSDNKKVVISEKTLSAYLMGNKLQSGIQVAVIKE